MASSSQNCIICNEDYSRYKSCVVQKKGMITLITASEVRNDGLFSRELQNCEPLRIHNSCRLKYTRKRDIDKLLNNAANNVAAPAVTLRSCAPQFEFKYNCVFCGNEASKAVEIKKPLHRRRIVHLFTLEQIIDSLRIHAQKKNDEVSKKFLLRISDTIDLVAAEARYHLDCYQDFQRPLIDSGEKPGRPRNTKLDTAFVLLCEFIKDADDCQFSLQELVQKMLELSNEEFTITPKSLKIKLQQHYGPNIIIIETQGKNNVILLRQSAEQLINAAWLEEKDANYEDKKKKIIQAAVAIILDDINSTVYENSHYKFQSNLKLAAEEKIPETLKQIIEGIVLGRDKSESKQRKCIAISHSIIAATRPRTFLSQMQVSLGVWLHRKYGSRQLIDMVAKLGFCASYSEVQKFELSAVQEAVTDISPEGYLQFVFDNADLDICTLTGRGTFHYMGGIKCVSPASAVRRVTAIKRVSKVSTLSVAEKIDYKIYQNSAFSGLSNVVMQSLVPTTITNLQFKHATTLDLISTVGRFVNDAPNPSWNGYMQVAITSCDPVKKTEVIFLPFITANPTDPNTIYSTIIFATNECRRQGQKLCVLTFDQQLYIKAMEVLLCKPDISKDVKIIIRLGGFHLLMSFLGAIGNIMRESGLDVMWATVYAPKSTVHMMNGHAVARALRAHFLSLEALITILIKNCKNFNEQLKQELKSLHNDLLNNTISPLEAVHNKSINKLYEIVEEELKLASITSRTSKLWHQYYELVTLLRLFIRAERTGDYISHLQVVTNMLPYFHATAHLNYAKSALLYIQSLLKLEVELNPLDYATFITYFSIRRNEEYFWSGVATDLVIEQELMRTMKVSGGLAGRGVTDDILITWIKSLPASLEYTQPLEEYVDLNAGTPNKHIELGKTRQKQDYKDATKFTDWLSLHSPLDKNKPELRNIATGLIADETINCDKALEIGIQLLKKVYGVKYGDIKLRRNDKVTSLAAMTRSVKIDDDLIIIDPNQLFHRMIITITGDKDLQDLLCYELTPHCASLFDDSVMMRKNNKSLLIHAIMDLIEDKAIEKNNGDTYIVDGGFLLHRVVWPALTTYSDIIEIYVTFVIEKYGSECYVVFDGYNAVSDSTKFERQMARSKSKNIKDVLFEESMVPELKQSDFLASSHNKARLIHKLTARLENKQIKVLQAANDADVLIVETALTVASLNNSVTVVGNDTDLIIMLLARAPSSANIKFYSPGCVRSKVQPKVYDITYMKNELQLTVKGLLMFHAMTGCDTTSSPYRIGKKTAFKIFHNNTDLLNIAMLFNEKDADKSDIITSGEKFLLSLYNSKSPTLNSARYQTYCKINASKKISSTFEIATLPPTSAAATQHSLRVYYQVQQWLGNQLQPTDWGWRLTSKNTLQPIPTLLAPAPEHLMKILRCNCLTDCSTMRCSCKKNGIKCSNICGHCRGTDCVNNCTADLMEDNELDVDTQHTVKRKSSNTSTIAHLQQRKRRKTQPISVREHHDIREERADNAVSTDGDNNTMCTMKPPSPSTPLTPTSLAGPSTTVRDTAIIDDAKDMQL